MKNYVFNQKEIKIKSSIFILLIFPFLTMVVPMVENYLNTILPNKEEDYLNTIIHLVEVEDFNILPNKEEDFLNIEEELIEEEDYPNILLVNFFLKLLNFLY